MNRPRPLEVWLNHWPLLPELTAPAMRRAQEFNREHPEFEVRVRGVDVRFVPKEMAAAVAEGRAPQVAAYQYSFTQEARDARAADGAPLFRSLEAAIGGRSEVLGVPVVVGDLLPNARAAYTFDGELLAMPRNPSTTVLYANMTLLAAAGVAAPPRTWAEVERACSALALLRGGPEHGVAWPNQSWFFEQSVAQQGGLLAEPDNGRSGPAEKVGLAGAEMLEFVTWWQRLHREGAFFYTGAPMGWQGVFDAFAEQRVALMLNSSVEAGPVMRAARAAGFEAVAAPMPYNDRVPFAGNLVAGDSLWLADRLDEDVTDGALAFLQYLAAPGAEPAEQADSRAFVPLTETAIARLHADGWYAERPHHLAALEQLRATTDSPATRGAVFGGFRAVQDMTAAAMHDVLTAGADPAERFAAATVQAQALIG
ncbi:extracellular solute-binding protein [Catenulispora subtropica]|uniref:ABC transporter substrate-binding protein n=1 Tax=Catenulispora subtropica TaxID=450798 RepID=A0ABN2T6B3_9ACTN